MLSWSSKDARTQRLRFVLSCVQKQDCLSFSLVFIKNQHLTVAGYLYIFSYGAAGDGDTAAILVVYNERSRDKQHKKEFRCHEIDDIDANCRDVERPENISRYFLFGDDNLACACDNP